MKEIKLTQGKTALVDDEDFEWINQWKWYALGRHTKRKNKDTSRTFYAVRKTPMIKGIRQLLLMHCEIIKTKGIDHINGDGLDNRRKNLRPATVQQNGANRKKQAGTTSKYKGINFDKARKKWRARIMVAGKRQELGLFSNEDDAAQAYDTSSVKLCGDFAKLNIISTDSDI